MTNLKTKILFVTNARKKNAIMKSSSNYFMTLDLAYQIKQLFSNSDIVDDVLRNLDS